MSESCQNCGSGMIEDDMLGTFCSIATLSPWACQRIGSLREELAAARDAERDQIERLEEALDQSVHALRWLHCHGMTSEFENKRKAAYDLARPLLEARGNRGNQ